MPASPRGGGRARPVPADRAFRRRLPEGVGPPHRALRAGRQPEWEEGALPPRRPRAAASRPIHRRYFDPASGASSSSTSAAAGRARRLAELRENTTWDLVADVERMRERLGIENGTCSAAPGARRSPSPTPRRTPSASRARPARDLPRCGGKELDWFYQDGASWLFPDAWEEYLEPIPAASAATHAAPTTSGSRRTTRRSGARRRARGRSGRARRASSSSTPTRSPSRRDAFADRFARIEAHYFVNGAFLRSDDQLLDNARQIRAPGRHRAGPLRRRVPDAALGPAPRLARGRAQHRAGRRPQHQGAGDPERARPGDGRLPDPARAVHAVSFADAFWAPRLETNRKVTIPYDFRSARRRAASTTSPWPAA